MKNEENKPKDIGSRIKVAREEAELSQLDLAKKLDFESATAISLIEKGDRNISIENLQKLADLLHRDIKYFLGQNEDKTVTVEYALRAVKSLTKEDRDAILRFVDMAKNKNNGKKRT